MHEAFKPTWQPGVVWFKAGNGSFHFVNLMQSKFEIVEPTHTKKCKQRSLLPWLFPFLPSHFYFLAGSKSVFIRLSLHIDMVRIESGLRRHLGDQRPLLDRDLYSEVFLTETYRVFFTESFTWQRPLQRQGLLQRPTETSTEYTRDANRQPPGFMWTFW